MNAYYENRNYAGTNVRDNTLPQSDLGEKLISFICNIVALFTCRTAVCIEKALFAVTLLFASFGVVGGIECGSISMLLGIAICAIISLVEFAVLKSLFKKPAVKSEES